MDTLTTLTSITLGLLQKKGISPCEDNIRHTICYFYVLPALRSPRCKEAFSSFSTSCLFCVKSQVNDGKTVAFVVLWTQGVQ